VAYGGQQVGNLVLAETEAQERPEGRPLEVARDLPDHGSSWMGGRMRLTDEQVDALDMPIHNPTIKHLKIRLEWGRRAGQAAYIRGCGMGENPFTKLPNMPMHQGWREGWLEFLQKEAAGD
jgi:hypothetical protein